MFKFLIVVLILTAFFLFSMFIDGLMKLHKQENADKKSHVKEGMEGYMDQTFGIGSFKIFKSTIDAEGKLRYLVYLPKYEWFKSPEYQWYEVYATNSGFVHIEIKE